MANPAETTRAMAARRYDRLESNEEMPGLENISLHSVSKSQEEKSIDSESYELKKVPAKGWKPVTLHLVTLVFVTAFTASLIAVLSYLLDLDATQSGLVFVPVGQGFPALTEFSYKYLPTLLSVTFGMLWNWIDLDIKRLEPFYQLSQPGGALAVHSLLLQYPHDFVAFAPIRAAKLRHWGVFIGGMVTVIMFWAVTPLQGAMFDVQTIEKSRTATLSAKATLDDLKNYQSNMSLDMTFLQTSWNIIWHGADLPHFTDREGTLLPAEINQVTSQDAVTFVTANITKLTTTLDCVPANWSLDRNTITVDNGKGCHFDTDLNIIGQTLVYYGYGDNPRAATSLRAMGCSQESVTNSFVAIVSAAATPGVNVTYPSNAAAQFCTPYYWTQDVEAILQWPGMAVNSTRALGALRHLPSDTVNTTLFETIISTEQMQYSAPSDVDGLTAPAVNSIAEFPELRDYKIGQQLDNGLSGYVLAASNINPTQFETLLDPTVLSKALQTAHQLLFAVAVASMLDTVSNQAHPSTTFNGKVTERLSALVTVAPFVYSIQALLAVIALCSLALAFHYWQRPSSLKSDPDSLRRVGKLAIDVDPTALEELIQQEVPVRFKLQHTSRTNELVLTCLADSRELLQSIESIGGNETSAYLPTRPFYLRRVVGFGFVVCLVAILSTLLALKRTSVIENGLLLPWTSAIIQQIVLNYLPTLLATVLEPFWTMLNRILCLLQPFEELRSIRARASASIDARYASLPPQLTIFRAIGAKHFLLATVCALTISENLLAVSLNALFDQVDTPFPSSSTFHLLKKPIFSNTSVIGGILHGLSQEGAMIAFQDHFYLASMNLSGKTDMPPWTGSDHFLLPLETSGMDPSTVYDVQSLGFSVDTHCQDLGMPTKDGPFQMQPVIFPASNSTSGYTEVSFDVVVSSSHWTKDSAKLHNCTLKSENYGFSIPPHGDVAVEAVTPLTGDDTSTCDQIMFVMYTRNFNLSIMGNASLQLDYSDISGTSQTFMACRTNISAAQYSAKILGSGKVVESGADLSKTELDMSDYFLSTNSSNPSQAASKMASMNAAKSQSLLSELGQNYIGHHSPASLQWFPHLMALAARSNNTLDSSKPAPTADELTPLIQAVNAKLGALVMYLQQDLIFQDSNDSGLQVRATFSNKVTRLFFNPVMFPLTNALLAFNILVAILFYWRAPQKLLPEMPTTILAQSRMFTGSSVAATVSENTKDERYGYGRFLGLDGKLHVGVERAPFVRPI